jgi:hypothetical protein
MRSNKNVYPYVELEVQLHSCVTDPDMLARRLREWLQKHHLVDFDTDIQIDIAAVVYP